MGISMELGSDIASVFKRYCESISQVQSNLRKAGYEFQHSDHLGYILTCPSQLGTGMRASVMIKLPLLSQRGDFRAVCANMKLDVRGGIEDVYDLSNHDTSQEYYLGKGSAMQGTGLKTNLLLTADTIPPDIYGQPRRVVPTVPALRPDYVSSTVPNVAYAVVEGPARRRLKGLSSNFLNLTPAPSQQAPSQVLIQPGLLDFGLIETGGTYRLPISLTNISVEISRFRVRQPRHALLKVLFTPGPVMAGMTTKMEVELTASVACVIE